jgi:hypothetical protein
LNFTKFSYNSSFHLQMGVLRVVSRTDIDVAEVSNGGEVFEGGTARLTCKAKGHPQPSVYWIREDKGMTITQWDNLTGEKKEGEKTVFLTISSRCHTQF